MTESLIAETPLAEETRGLARSASIIALGNVASRVLGLVRDTDLADTLTQECFLRAYRKRKGFRGEASVGTCLLYTSPSPRD